MTRDPLHPGWRRPLECPPVRASDRSVLGWRAHRRSRSHVRLRSPGSRGPGAGSVAAGVMPSWRCGCVSSRELADAQYPIRNSCSITLHIPKVSTSECTFPQPGRAYPRGFPRRCPLPAHRGADQGDPRPIGLDTGDPDPVKPRPRPAWRWQIMMLATGILKGRGPLHV